MAAEIQYLESIEESVRHLGDVERLMGVSMAQQESATLAQMLKVKKGFVFASNKNVWMPLSAQRSSAVDLDVSKVFTYL